MAVRVGTHLTMVVRAGLAVLLVGTVLLTAQPSISAHPMSTSLPILRPGYGGISPDGTVGFPLDTAVDGFNPLLELVNASLVRYLPGGRVVPDLATPAISKNHLVYTFTIRKNARFSNGHPVTAWDAEFSLTRDLATTTPFDFLPFLRLIRGAESFKAGKTTTLSGVKVLNARTLRITISKPAAYFLGILSRSESVLDRSVVGGKPIADPSGNAQANYLGNTCTGNQGAGPFTFVCHDRSSTLHSFYSGSTPKYTLVPNPYYYGHKPHIRIELRAFEKPYNAYLAGMLDSTGVPLPFLSQWRGKSNQFHEYPTTLVRYLTPNVHLAPFDNVHCRLAVAYAIDRDTLFNKVLGGFSRPTYAVVPRGILGYYSGKDNPHYNLTKARLELARCPGRTTPVELTGVLSNEKKLREFIVGGLATAGFNIKLKLLSADEMRNIRSKPLDQSGTQMIPNGWSADYLDPQDFCSLLLRSGQQYNYGGWHNTSFDRLVDKADVTVNRKSRAALYARAQHIALSQGAFISLSNDTGFVLIKPYVYGLIADEAGLLPKNGDWASVSISPH